MKKTAIVIGAGSGGLIAAKELKEQGIEVKIVERHSTIGGIWVTLPWQSYTLTSSRWVTEYGCFPMPEEWPDFVTSDNMRDYLDHFVDQYELRSLIEFGVSVKAIEKGDDGRLTIVTDTGTYPPVDFVVVSAGLHGKPSMPEIDGLDKFKGEVLHSFKYDSPEPFRDKKVLCVGLGESGVGLTSELAPVTDRLVVSSTGVAIAPRVIKGSNNPFDQMQFWQIGRHMIGYQELLTSGLSWFYRKIPRVLKKINITFNLKFYSDYGVSFDQFEPWFPKEMVPHHFHVKFWVKPYRSTASGNMTRLQNPPDDLLYLIKTERLIPKGEVESFDEEGVRFADGSYEKVDVVLLNTGYKPGSHQIQFADDWHYKHLDLFKGCIHPTMPNLAFVGMVRPTIGSIPAMAEMHSRIIAAYFAERIPLPKEAERQAMIEADNAEHFKQCPTLHERFPHIYFFDEWMDRMAFVIDAQPRLRDHLGSLAALKAYFLGAPMPLRFRTRGIGKIEGAAEIYSKRVSKVWDNAFGRWAATTVIIHFLTPYLLALLTALLGITVLGLPVSLSLLGGVGFYLLYRYVDLFRYVFEIGFARTMAIASGLFFIKRLKKELPNYEQPEVFQTLD